MPMREIAAARNVALLGPIAASMTAVDAQRPEGRDDVGHALATRR